MGNFTIEKVDKQIVVNKEIYFTPKYKPEAKIFSFKTSGDSYTKVTETDTLLKEITDVFINTIQRMMGYKNDPDIEAHEDISNRTLEIILHF